MNAHPPFAQVTYISVATALSSFAPVRRASSKFTLRRKRLFSQQKWKMLSFGQHKPGSTKVKAEATKEA
jgi:hypothetical protein